MIFDQKKCESIAQDLLGMKFKMGGRGPEEIDCYGVLVYFFREFGVDLPDYSYLDDWNPKEEYYLKEYASFFRRLDPQEVGAPRGVGEAATPQGNTPLLIPGDMILFQNVEGASNHAGVYIGDGKFIHAYRKIGTKIDRLVSPIWKKKIYGYLRLKT